MIFKGKARMSALVSARELRVSEAYRGGTGQYWTDTWRVLDDLPSKWS